jgi:hypothetical protein
MAEIEIIQTIRFLLEGKKNGTEPLEIIAEPRFDTYRPDLIIKAGKKNIAAIEIKTSNTLSKALTGFSADFYFLFKVRCFLLL